MNACVKLVIIHMEKQKRFQLSGFVYTLFLFIIYKV